MSSLRISALIISAIAVGLSVTAIGFSPSPQVSEIQVGALLCYSGSCAEWGTAALHGAQLAVDDINGRGGLLGKRLSLVAEDSREDTPAASVSAYRSLVARSDVHYILGPTWTAAAQALLPVARMRSDVLMISPSVGVRDFNEAAPHLFNVWPHDDVGTTALAEHVYRLGLRRVAVTSSLQPWEKLQGDTFQRRFEALGGNIVARIDPIPSATDLKSEALTLYRAQPEAVFFAGMIQMGLVARELKQLGFAGQKFAILMDQTRIAEARGGLDGTQFAFYPDGSPAFAERYRTRFGSEPSASAGTAYDALLLLAKAIQQAGSTTVSEVQRALQSVAGYPGVSGDITMDGRGGVAREPKLLQVQNTNYIAARWAS